MFFRERMTDVPRSTPAKSMMFWALLLAVAFDRAACSPAKEPPRSTSSQAATSPAASASGLTLVVGSARRGAIVTLESTTPREFQLPAGPAVMDQLGKQFVPALLFVRVGQAVEFRNSEDMPHNVHVRRSRTGTAVFDVSTDAFQKYTHMFDESGQYDVSCDLHAGMQATVIATTTPYAAVADDRGSFTIPDVAAGSYKVILDQADTGRTVEVSGPRTEITVGSS
jgi:plastocyanin